MCVCCCSGILSGFLTSSGQTEEYHVKYHSGETRFKQYTSRIGRKSAAPSRLNFYPSCGKVNLKRDRLRQYCSHTSFLTVKQPWSNKSREAGDNIAKAILCRDGGLEYDAFVHERCRRYFERYPLHAFLSERQCFPTEQMQKIGPRMWWFPTRGNRKIIRETGKELPAPCWKRK
jgi:hypothetical protein